MHQKAYDFVFGDLFLLLLVSPLDGLADVTPPELSGEILTLILELVFFFIIGPLGLLFVEGVFDFLEKFNLLRKSSLNK